MSSASSLSSNVAGVSSGAGTTGADSDGADADAIIDVGVDATTDIGAHGTDTVADTDADVCATGDGDVCVDAGADACVDARADEDGKDADVDVGHDDAETAAASTWLTSSSISLPVKH